MAEQARLRRPLSIQWFNLCDYYLSAAAAAAVYQRAVPLLPADALGHLTAALSAGCVFILLNRVLLAGALWLARGLSPIASGLFHSELLAPDLIITLISRPVLLLPLLNGPCTSPVPPPPPL